jgi:hypothetical protein
MGSTSKRGYSFMAVPPFAGGLECMCLEADAFVTGDRLPPG